MAAKPIVHFELMGADGDSQRDFYRDIFEWEFQNPEGFDNYHMVSAEATSLGGAVGQGNEQMPAYQTLYIQVPSIDETLAAIEATGGKAVTPRTEIPGMVTFALFNDPGGNLVGLVEESTPDA